jgi:uncharacterized protein (DUF427 family)
MTRPVPHPVAAGQESVWDYPRPPRLERTHKRLRVVLGGEVIADTTRGYRVLERSHPPNYYLPVVDVLPGALEPVEGSSFCEWKGRAHYYTVRGGDRGAPNAAWGYETPSEAFAPLRDHVAFYVEPMDACYVDDEQVVAQPGTFYGGWITADIVGPYKGGPGSRSW